MPRILYGNFDFEYEIESANYRPTAKLEVISAQLAPFLAALGEDGDFLLSPDGFLDGFLQAASRAGFARIRAISENPALDCLAGRPAELTPWGNSLATRALAERNNWRMAGPDPAIVRRVNDRLFASHLESEMDCGLPGSQLIESHGDLLQAIRQAAERTGVPEDLFEWVVKSRFGMASRSRILGRGPALSDAVAGWLWKQFDRNGSVQFEPWVSTETEFSTQWVIPQAGEAVLRGWTRILRGRGGIPMGWSRLGEISFADCELAKSLPALQSAVERIADTGYFGPVGIDSMRCVVAGEAGRMRPLQDINARYTMGRLALETADRLAPARPAIWLHVPTSWLCEILDVASRVDADRFYMEHGLEITDRIRHRTAAWTDEARAWLTSPLWMSYRGKELQPLRSGLLVTAREAGTLMSWFEHTSLPTAG